jgi:hypothetical protein
MRFERRAIVVTAMLLGLGCSKNNDYCPGTCPLDTVFPSMTIQTFDGAASIARAKIVSGPCSHLLVHSSGEAGVQTGYAAVQVTYNGPVSIPPLCLVEVTSLAGESIVVTTSVTSSSYTQACCPYGTCCLKDNAISTHHRVVFDQPTQTVTFSASYDGGVDDAATDGPGSSDAHARDEAQASGIDSLSVTDASMETSTVDASDVIDSKVTLDESVDL